MPENSSCSNSCKFIHTGTSNKKGIITSYKIHLLVFILFLILKMTRICLLSQKKMGSAWIFYGMATKMSFELGLHRKIKNDEIQNTEVKEMRDMAFWGCFIGEVYVFYYSILNVNRSTKLNDLQFHNELMLFVF